MANDTPLMDTGLDSLSAVQFRNDLTRDFNVKLPASLMPGAEIEAKCSAQVRLSHDHGSH